MKKEKRASADVAVKRIQRDVDTEAVSQSDPRSKSCSPPNSTKVKRDSKRCLRQPDVYEATAEGTKTRLRTRGAEPNPVPTLVDGNANKWNLQSSGKLVNVVPGAASLNEDLAYSLSIFNSYMNSPVRQPRNPQPVRLQSLPFGYASGLNDLNKE